MNTTELDKNAPKGDWSKKEAFKLLKEWQNTLGLNDWTITMDLLDLEEVGNGKAYQETEYEESVKAAVIHVAHYEQLADYNKKLFNFERTLIHELLHIKFCLLDDEKNSLQSRVLHQIVDDLSKSFYITKYKNKENK